MHSTLVGGSTASRVINCPGSVALVAKMPVKPASSYADEGTLLHDAIAQILTSTTALPDNFIGRELNGTVLTQELVENKLKVALAALDEIDPYGEMEVEIEARVGFGALIPDAWGSADLIGRLGQRTIVLDWKFGDGVAVEAENNKQLLFYAAAARHTEQTRWAFLGTRELELIIVQPPSVKRWVTTFDTLDAFEDALTRAVKLAREPEAPLQVGEHCRWCNAKPICPLMTGAVDRALKARIDAMDGAQIGDWLRQADLIEGWIKGVRDLALTMLENDAPVAGYKMVSKRAIRQWADEDAAIAWLTSQGVAPMKQELLSPAQAEKVLKKSKLALPDDLVVAVSSGSTVVPESDPRPAVLNIGRQLTAALTKLR